jgi:hypothetical protein
LGAAVLGSLGRDEEIRHTEIRENALSMLSTDAKIVKTIQRIRRNTILTKKQH